jgi:acyl-CoA thioesterase FadM
MQGLVFNAHWLSYFDEAAMRFLESVGHTPAHPLDDFTASVVRAELAWKGPAGLSDMLWTLAFRNFSGLPFAPGCRPRNVRYEA